MGHGTAVTEASCEDLLLIDTKTIGKVLNESIDKSNILPTTVRPTSIEAVGCHKDSALVREAFKSVPAVGNIIHGATEPVEAERKPQGRITVGVWDMEDVVAAGAVNVDAGLSTLQAGAAAAAGGLGEHTSNCREGESECGEGKHVDQMRE